MVAPGLRESLKFVRAVEKPVAAAQTGETLAVGLALGLLLGPEVAQPASSATAAPSADIRARTGLGVDIGLTSPWAFAWQPNHWQVPPVLGEGPACASPAAGDPFTPLPMPGTPLTSGDATPELSNTGGTPLPPTPRPESPRGDDVPAPSP